MRELSKELFSMQKVKNIFVSGASGFIGGNLIYELCKLDYNVIAFVRSDRNKFLVEKYCAKKLVGDIKNTKSYQHHLEGIDVVFHLASRVDDWGSKKKFHDTTVEGTKKIYFAAKKAGVKKFIFLSSASVIDSSSGLYNNRWNQTNSKLPYIESKKNAEKFLFEEMKKGGIEIVIIRAAWVYGKGDRNFVPGIVKFVRSGKFFLINGASNKIPIINVHNLTDILVKTMKENKATGQVLLAADNNNITWKDFVNLVAKKMNKNVKFYILPFIFVYPIASVFEFFYKLFSIKKRPQITRFVVKQMALDVKIDMTATEEALFYKPKFTLDSGIQESINYLNTLK